MSYTMQAGGYDSLVELRHTHAAAGLSATEDSRRAGLEAYYDAKLEIFRRLLADGMLPRLVISSDAGPFDCEFGRMVYGLRLAVQGGMTSLQAIEAATRVAAEACGVSQLVGTLEPGKEADLFVVGGNPLDNIEHIADVQAVYLGGRPVGPLPPDAVLSRVQA